MVQNFVICVRMHALVHGSIKITRRTGVKLPEIFRFPGGKSFRTDRPDVRMREQANHFQAIRRANGFGKLRDGAGIVDVSAKSRAHVEMMFNQKQYRFPVGSWQLEPFQARLGNRQACGDRII